MITRLCSVVGEFPDKRIVANTHFSMSDIALSAFAEFFTQSESFPRLPGEHELSFLCV